MLGWEDSQLRLVPPPFPDGLAVLLELLPAGTQNQQVWYVSFKGLKSEVQCWFWVPLANHKPSPRPRRACLSQIEGELILHK